MHAFPFNSSSCLSEHIVCHVCIVNHSTLQEGVGRKWKQLFEKSQLKGESECLCGCCMSILSWANILRTTCWYLKNIGSGAHLLSKCWSPFFWTGVECPSDFIQCLHEGLWLGGKPVTEQPGKQSLPLGMLIRIESYQYRSFHLSFWSPQFLIFSNWGTPTSSSPQSTQRACGLLGWTVPVGYFFLEHQFFSMVTNLPVQ